MINDDEVMDETLEGWVASTCSQWRDHYRQNYQAKDDEYYRLYRGIWASQDKGRESERSRIISPALQQAVESSVSEVEEASFGRGQIFDIRDDVADTDNADIQLLRKQLTEDFHRTQVRKSTAECILNAAIFGNGVAEIVLEEVKEFKPATQPALEGELQAIGTEIRDRVVARPVPVSIKNFLIDPNATTLEDAMGCAVERFVSEHSVRQLQERGVYRDVHIGTAAADMEIEADKEINYYQHDKVKLTKYYGLVPRELLKKAVDDEEAEAFVEGESDSYYVEAIVVLGNDSELLKAEANPYLMGDRPIVDFQWDIIPGQWRGRGVSEKGYNSQKALDAEIRARIDALALTVAPMMAVDSSRIPRGHKLEVRPGKMLLVNGDPKEALHPFNFGQVSQITFAQAGELQKMVQTATGAVDSAGIAGNINGEATAAGISMSLGALMKRQKRTLINFQESFLIPMVQKLAWRYMQYDPENYPVGDYKFTVSGSLGVIAREYEVSQLVQLLQTMSADSPLYGELITSIIDNMNLSNREELLAKLEQAQQPTPEQQQAMQAAEQQKAERHAAEVGVFTSQAAESNARATKYQAEAAAVPAKVEIDKIEAVTRNLHQSDTDDKKFNQRIKIADVILREEELSLKKAMAKDGGKEKPDNVEMALMRKLGLEG